MDVIILAGGFGTRLSGVVKDVPKPMAPINKRPFLRYVFDWLSAFPVTNIVLSVGYKSDVIKDYFGANYGKFNITYAEETTPLGTGGAIKYALSKTNSDDVLIINGDTYFPVNISDFFNFHQKNSNALSIALKYMVQFDRYGSVELTGNKIAEFKEKKYLEEGLINGGIYLINKKAINFENLPEVFSFENEVLEKAVVKGIVSGMVFDDTFIDIGVPEDYQKACELL